MKNLSVPNLFNFQNAAFNQFIKDTVALCNTHDTAALFIKVFVDALAACIDPLHHFYSLGRVNKSTAILQQLDDRRDKAIKGIRNVADGFCFHFDEPVSTGGKLILDTINKFGPDIAGRTYAVETEIIDKLILDFTTNPAIAAAVNLLNLGDWVKELADANKIFNQHYISRSRDTSNIVEGNMQEQRKIAMEKYRKLAAKINAYHEIHESKEFDDLIKGLNDITDRANHTVNTKKHTEQGGLNNKQQA